MPALVYNPSWGERRTMTYEEIVAQGALPPDKNMWGRQCRRDLRVNHKPGCRRSLLFDYSDACKHKSRCSFCEIARDKLQSTITLCVNFRLDGLIIWLLHYLDNIVSRGGLRWLVTPHQSTVDGRCSKIAEGACQQHVKIHPDLLFISHTPPLPPQPASGQLWAGQSHPQQGLIHWTTVPIIWYSFAGKCALPSPHVTLQTTRRPSP